VWKSYDTYATLRVMDHYARPIAYLVGYEATGGIDRCFQASENSAEMKLPNSDCVLWSSMTDMGAGHQGGFRSRPKSDQPMAQKLKQHEGALEDCYQSRQSPNDEDDGRRNGNSPVHSADKAGVSETGKREDQALLDEFCKEKGLKSIAESTIGKVIKRHKLFTRRPEEFTMIPVSSDRLNRSVSGSSDLPARGFWAYHSRHRRAGNGRSKGLLLQCIDAKLKFALTLNYKRLNSKNMKDFYERFNAVYLFRSKTGRRTTAQKTLGNSIRHCKKLPFPICLSIPVPKINSIIERYNRTIQEEFIDNHLDIIHDKPLFHEHLAEYIVFYLTKRIHKSLDKMTLSTISSKKEVCRICMELIHSVELVLSCVIRYRYAALQLRSYRSFREKG